MTRLEEIALRVLIMIEACGYGGNNAGTARRHARALRSELKARGVVKRIKL